MIDFFKARLDQHSVDALLDTPMLDFKGRLSYTTGETEEDLLTAEYGSLTFKVIHKRYISLSGSLHKFWQSNCNYADYTFNDLQSTLHEIANLFALNLNLAKIENLEFGVNLSNPPIQIEKFLAHVLRYKGHTFHPMKRGSLVLPGIDCQTQRFRIKLYNKGKQYAKITNGTSQILRYELHVDRMAYFKNANVSIQSLADLLNPENLAPLAALLTSTFANILIFDYRLKSEKASPKDRRLVNEGKHAKFWEDLKKENVGKHNRLRRRLRAIEADQLGQTQQQAVTKLVFEKWQHLLSEEEPGK